MKLKINNLKFNKADLRRGLKIPVRVTSELAEETGLHIGDGSMNFYHNHNYFGGKYALRGHITDDVKHYDNKIKKLYFSLYNIKINPNRMESTGVYGFQLWSDGLVNFKHKVLGLPLGNKLYIKIPSCFFAQKDCIIGVIRGIFDTDGCIYLENKNNKLYPRVKIVTVSYNLSKQLITLLTRLGFRVSKFREKRSHLGWNDNYIVSVNGDGMLRKWMDVIKPTNPKHIAKYDFYISKF